MKFDMDTYRHKVRIGKQIHIILECIEAVLFPDDEMFVSGRNDLEMTLSNIGLEIRNGIPGVAIDCYHSLGGNEGAVMISNHSIRIAPESSDEIKQNQKYALPLFRLLAKYIKEMTGDKPEVR